MTIAAWTSASTQALDDIGMLQVFIDLVLTAAVLTEIDRQALVGLGPARKLFLDHEIALLTTKPRTRRTIRCSIR